MYNAMVKRLEDGRLVLVADTSGEGVARQTKKGDTIHTLAEVGGWTGENVPGTDLYVKFSVYRRDSAITPSDKPAGTSRDLFAGIKL